MFIQRSNVETRCSWKTLILCCRDQGTNQGPLDLQSNALPTELSLLPSWMTSAKSKLHSFFRYFHAESVCRMFKRWNHVFIKTTIFCCRDPGSIRGPLDLQSNALPTELSRLRNWMTSADRKLHSSYRFFHAKSDCTTVKRWNYVFMKNRFLVLPRPGIDSGTFRSSV